MPRRAFQGQTIEDLLGLSPGPGTTNLTANAPLLEMQSQNREERQQRNASEDIAAYMPAVLDGSAPDLEGMLLKAIGRSQGIEAAIKFSASLDKFRGEKAIRDAELFRTGADLGLKSRQIESQITRDAQGNVTGATATNRGKETILPTTDMFPGGQVPEGQPFFNVPGEMTLEDFVRQGGIPGLPRSPEELDKAVQGITKQSDFFLKNFYANFPGANIDPETGEVTVGEGQDQEAAQKTLNLIQSQIPPYGRSILLQRSQFLNKRTPKSKNKKDGEDDWKQDLNNMFNQQSRLNPLTREEDMARAALDEMGFGTVARAIMPNADPDPDELYVSELEAMFPGQLRRG